MPVTSIVVALQKVFDTPFVAPLDVPDGATTDHTSLRERYWSVFNPDASFQARERDLLARIAEVYNREQGLAAKEADFERRKREVYEREQYVAAHDRAAHMLAAPVGAMHKAATPAACLGAAMADRSQAQHVRYFGRKIRPHAIERNLSEDAAGLPFIS